MSDWLKVIFLAESQQVTIETDAFCFQRLFIRILADRNISIEKHRFL